MQLDPRLARKWPIVPGDGGRVTLTGVLVTIPPVNGGGYASQSGGRQYYGPDEKLMVVQRYDYRVGSGASLGSWEEYWYDALGRRILTRARRSGSPPTGTGPLCNDPAGSTCQSYYQRTLWDGDQILYEWRVADGTTTGYNSGTAGYVHVEGIDQPVGLIRSDGTRVLNYTWRGLGESSVFTNGAPGDISIPGGSLAVQWPTRTQGGVYFTPNVLASGASGPFTWFGTLAENGAGSTGLLYRRNRYFDPVSGRFTQADPIGLAGGLNLYGFANGDPVNFADPFGLMACPPLCGYSQRHLQIEVQFQEDLTPRDRLAFGAMTVGAVGGAALVGRVVGYFLGGGGAATIAGAGSAGGMTAKAVSALQRAGPDLEARTNAILGAVPKNLNVLMQDRQVGGQLVRTISGGTGDRLREFTLRADGSSTVRAFDAASKQWKTLADILPPK